MVISSTPSGPVTDSATGSVSPLPAGPTIADTPSSSMRRRASSTACWGDVAESPWTSSIGWPWTPPAALISFTASSAAWRKGCPKSERSPVKGKSDSDAQWPSCILGAGARTQEGRKERNDQDQRSDDSALPGRAHAPQRGCFPATTANRHCNLLGHHPNHGHAIPRERRPNPPAPLRAHRAVDGLQHEPRQTSLVYAKCVVEMYGMIPASAPRCA